MQGVFCKLCRTYHGREAQRRNAPRPQSEKVAVSHKRSLARRSLQPSPQWTGNAIQQALHLQIKIHGQTLIREYCKHLGNSGHNKLQQGSDRLLATYSRLYFLAPPDGDAEEQSQRPFSQLRSALSTLICHRLLIQVTFLSELAVDVNGSTSTVNKMGCSLLMSQRTSVL